ncbi:jg22562 [Pararge aegeria aegeria]|uniref:Jg22562 protein n=1 Tax=Pararge aegeria aegeria TaxID=348720 RepID=A0A8S4QKD7_9NEOP|nr:jg22562 [Pararge aegeria aegeria]
MIAMAAYLGADDDGGVGRDGGRPAERLLAGQGFHTGREQPGATRYVNDGRTDHATFTFCPYKVLWNPRIDLASNPVKFGDDRSTPIFELSNCQIQLLFTMMIFYCWVYMGVDNDLHPLEKSIEENEYGEK